jgi:hypothetical protein
MTCLMLPIWCSVAPHGTFTDVRLPATESMAAWIPQSFEDVCKRNAGRRKLHRRKRNARADRIMRILGAMDSAGAMELRDTTWGLLAAASIDGRAGCDHPNAAKLEDRSRESATVNFGRGSVRAFG